MQKALGINPARYKKLELELRYALSKTTKEDYKKWALYTSFVFPQVTVRRAKNLA